MSPVTYRPDYAKFVFTVPPQTWNQYSRTFHEASHERKYKAEWLKSHKMNRWYYNKEQDLETWSVDIWGEWAGIVELLPIDFFQHLRRYDIRATIWDTDEATIIDIGQHLQRTITSHNINVFSTKPASKRLGRDRGGKGFAIGSKKSDLRISVYKRSGEPCAQEFQCTGTMLRTSVDLIWKGYKGRESVINPWRALLARVQSQGEARIGTVFGKADIGTYWPVFGPADLPALPPIQSSMLVLPEEPAPNDDGSQDFGDYDG